MLITITNVQLPRPSGKPYSPPDAATEKGLDGTVGHWFTTNPEVSALRHPRVHDFPIGLKSGTPIRTYRERLDDVRSKKAAAASIDGASLLPVEKRPDLLMCCCMANSKKKACPMDASESSSSFEPVPTCRRNIQRYYNQYK